MGGLGEGLRGCRAAPTLSSGHEGQAVVCAVHVALASLFLSLGRLHGRFFLEIHPLAGIEEACLMLLSVFGVVASCVLQRDHRDSYGGGAVGSSLT